MRSTILIALLLAPAALLPVAAGADECATSVCATTPTVQGKTYYIYAQGATCATSPTDNDACGRPAAPGSPAPLKFVGLLYQETNGLGGLQRKAVTVPPTTFAPDQMILL